MTSLNNTLNNITYALIGILLSATYILTLMQWWQNIGAIIAIVLGLGAHALVIKYKPLKKKSYIQTEKAFAYFLIFFTICYVFAYSFIYLALQNMLA